MRKTLDFETLVAICRQTHEEMRGRTIKAVHAGLVVRNWLFGHHIREYEQSGRDRAAYGEGLLKNLSKQLTELAGKGFSVDNLELFRRFYRTYPTVGQLEEKSETPSRISDKTNSETLSRNLALIARETDISIVWQNLAHRFPLSWSHYVTLLGIRNADERRFYEIEAAANDWSLRELKRQTNSSLYERLSLSRDKDEIRRLAREGQIVESAADLIKNPYVLEFLGLDERAAYSENDLETAIIDKLEHFLLELGKGFLFEARQKRFTFDEDHYFVDLVFYNRLLRCYTLIDLKIGELTHQDLGQMQMYVNYYDRHVITPDERPTIGIVLCKRQNDALVELTLPKEANIFAPNYQLYLPSKEELKQVVMETGNNQYGSWTRRMETSK